MRATHAEERRGAKGTGIPLMSLARGGGVVQRIHVSSENAEGNITVNKRLYLSTAALMLLSPFAAFADEPTGPTVWDGFSGWLSPDWSQDFSATVGVKIWINDWQRDSFLSGGVTTFDPTAPAPGQVDVASSDRAPDNQESDIEPVPIPQLSARYKWLFVTGSYYAKTGFDFDDTEGTTTAFVDTDGDGVLDTGAESTTLFSTSGDRYEWDASGGVYIHPYVALLGGYKKVRQEIDNFATQETVDLATGATIGTASATSFSDIDIEGPTIGIAASVPIGRGFGVYASYAHGFLDAEIRDVERTANGVDLADPDCAPFPCDSRAPDTDATYDVAELGFSYTHGTEGLAPHMPLSAATVYAGYRYQNISTEFDEPDQDRSDVTRGFAVGLNLTF
jgi:hypothetical protein